MLNIADIVGQYVKLHPEGDTHYTGKCPFCSSGDNSLILSQENPNWSLDKQAWSCLSCGTEGDRYDFVARSEHVSRAEAILLVAHHANTGTPFPHARFTIQTTPVPDETALAAGQTAPPPPLFPPTAFPSARIQAAETEG
jgi:DNA primase